MIKTRLIHLLSQAKKYILFQVFWQWLALLCQIVIVYSISGLLSSVLFRDLDRAMVFRFLPLLLAAVLLRFLSERMAAAASYRASVDVKRVLREKIYHKLLQLGTSYREYVTSSELVQMTTEGVEQLEIYFGRYLPQFFYAFLAPLTLFAALSSVNLPSALVLLFCVPLIPLSILLVQKIAKKLLSRYWGVYTGLGDSFLESLQGLTTLKIYQADEERAALMDEQSEKFRKATMRVLMMQLNSTSVMDIVAYGGAAAGMIAALRELAAGRLSVFGALMVLLLASEFFIPMRILGSFFHIAMNGMAASDKIFRLLDIYQEDIRRERPGAEGTILVKDLSFSYGGESGRKLLRDVNMLLPAGSFIALVGTSGSGKSTIANLLLGRKRGYAGSIQIGGEELHKISEESLMVYLTCVDHDSYLFKGSVRENLLMGNPEASEEELWEVLGKVKLSGFIKERGGLDSSLNEAASDLSGGQRQRLALARALLHDSRIYLFDEATSNIDAESEEMIMEVIHALSREGKTILLISHRLANVVDSDCIYLLKDGTISEKGRHEELMQRRGAYARLYRSQKELESYAASGKAVPR